MKKLLILTAILLWPLTAVAEGTAPDMTAADVNAIQKMTVETLKERLGKGDRVAIIDSRTGHSWDSSNVKIKGAIRIPFPDVEKIAASKIPMGYEAVVYCT